jgi:hypothetical protein
MPTRPQAPDTTHFAHAWLFPTSRKEGEGAVGGGGEGGGGGGEGGGSDGGRDLGMRRR